MTSPQILTQAKAALRVEALERRDRLTALHREQAVEAIAARLADELDLPPGAAVAGYWPLADELDPRPAMNRLAARGHPLALPRMDGLDRPLGFHAWQPGAALIRGGFKVMEPSAAHPARVPTVVLVPLLAFDRRGGRLGYGKGYYDRTLTSLRSRAPATLAIGLAFADQEVDRVPTGPRDAALDIVVTEAALHHCVRPDWAGTGQKGP